MPNPVDWSRIFDQLYPEPGASEEGIAQLVDDARRPLSAAEIEAIRRRDRGLRPFDDADPVRDPDDPSRWRLPQRPPPRAWLDFLRWSDGGEFHRGDRVFQFFETTHPDRGVRATMLDYRVPPNLPDALPFAFNGGGRFYCFDMREEAVDGEYPVVAVGAGALDWSECRLVGWSFFAACYGKVDVDSLPLMHRPRDPGPE